jgi:hypothetical protein
MVCIVLPAIVILTHLIVIAVAQALTTVTGKHLAGHVGIRRALDQERYLATCPSNSCFLHALFQFLLEGALYIFGLPFIVLYDSLGRGNEAGIDIISERRANIKR